MSFDESIVDRVRLAAAKQILLLPHAIRQMARPEPPIWPAEIRHVVGAGELVEDYPEDVRGHSCLLLGFDNSGRPIHVVCAPKEEYLAVITAYVPDRGRWAAGFNVRRTT